MYILVSACLLGEKCRYDGSGKMLEELKEAYPGDTLVPVCPELLGGLPAPRTPAERIGDRILTKTGEDVTEEYRKGAGEVLKLAHDYNCRMVVLKERSPSCGYGRIYDGSFTGRLIDGSGVTAELLAEHGIRVIGESFFKSQD